MKHRLGVFLALLLSLACRVEADAVVFAFEVFPPYQYYENGRLVGTDVEVISEACRRMGHQAVFRELPWARALAEAQAGKVDGIFSLVATPERKTFLHFPEEPISFEQYVFLVRKEATLSIRSAADLKGLRVGVCRGYAYDPAFDADPSFTRELSLNDEQQLRKLLGGRMQVAIMNLQVFQHTARKQGWSGVFKLMPYAVETRHALYVAFSKATGGRGLALTGRFNQLLKTLKREGFVEAAAGRCR